MCTTVLRRTVCVQHGAELSLHAMKSQCKSFNYSAPKSVHWLANLIDSPSLGWLVSSARTVQPTQSALGTTDKASQALRSIDAPQFLQFSSFPRVHFTYSHQLRRYTEHLAFRWWLLWEGIMSDLLSPDPVNQSLRSCSEEFDTLEQEYQRLEDAQRNFNRSIIEMQRHQNECFKEIKHQKYRMKQIKDQLKR